MKITEINGLNDSVIEREATPEEIAQITKDSNEAEAAKAEQELIAAQKAIDKAALLDRLGITADEAALLLS
jgi:hypothetical protein